MPTYEYKCQKCQYIFETFQKMAEKPLEFCPKCGGKVKRLISAAGLIFKGSGFHVTDYGKKNMAESKTTAKKTGKETVAPTLEAAKKSEITEKPKSEKKESK